MNALSIAEKKALELMQKDNFRGISKDNVLQLMSILDKVDPEVAKSIIAQLPEAIRGSVELERAYSNVLTKGMESIESTAVTCFETEDDIILSLGGGTPINPNCSAILKEKTKCIFLTCSPKVLAARMLLLQDGRPLVKNLLANHKSSTPEEKLQILEQWAKEKLQEREPIYKACSVKTVDTSGWDIEKILKQILRG